MGNSGCRAVCPVCLFWAVSQLSLGCLWDVSQQPLCPISGMSLGCPVSGLSLGFQWCLGFHWAQGPSTQPGQPLGPPQSIGVRAALMGRAVTEPGASRGEEPRVRAVRQVLCPEGHAEGAYAGARQHPRVPVCRVRERCVLRPLHAWLHPYIPCTECQSHDGPRELRVCGKGVPPKQTLQSCVTTD